jgi:hypothetical protein
MYKALAFVDERSSGDPGYLGRLDLTQNNGYVPQSLSLGLPQVRKNVYPRPARHGTDDSTRRMGARSIGLVVGVLDKETGSNLEEHELVEQFMAWMNPEVRFRLLLAGGRSLVVHGDSVDSEYQFDEVNFHMLKATMVAPEGIIEASEAEARTGIFAPDSYSIAGRPYPLAYPRSYPMSGVLTGPSVLTCNNTGRMISYPELIFTGPCTNPGAININTNKRMQIDLVLLTTDTVIIDMEKHRVYFNGQQAFYQSIRFGAADFGWWGLNPNVQTNIRLVADSAGAGTPSTPAQPAYLQPTTGTASSNDPGPLPNDVTFVWKIRGPIVSGAVANHTIVSQYEADPQRAWLIRRDELTGSLIWSVTTTGLAAAAVNRTLSPQAITGAEDETMALSVTINNGSSQSVITPKQFDGTNWVSQPSTTGSVLNPFDSNTLFRIGAHTVNTEPFEGRIYSVECRTGLDPLGGTVIWRFDAAERTGTGTTFTDPRGRVWTLTNTAAVTPAVAYAPGTPPAAGTVKWRPRWL